MDLDNEDPGNPDPALRLRRVPMLPSEGDNKRARHGVSAFSLGGNIGGGDSGPRVALQIL